MLLSEKSEVTLNPSNKFHFINLGYEYVKGKKILVPIKHLTKGSRSIVNVKCDYCKNIFTLKYKMYLNKIKNNENIACNNCKSINTKKTKLEKYGDENYCNSDELPRH